MEVEVLDAGPGNSHIRTGAAATTFLKLQPQHDLGTGTKAPPAPPPAVDINFTTMAPQPSPAYSISLGWTQIAECPSRDCTQDSNLTHVGILASTTAAPPGGGLWQMTPGVARAFATVVRTSLESPQSTAVCVASLSLSRARVYVLRGCSWPMIPQP